MTIVENGNVALPTFQHVLLSVLQNVSLHCPRTPVEGQRFGRVYHRHALYELSVLRLRTRSVIALANVP